ncbi:uncharacterized protein DUF3784 [Sinobaca qinghaiensis]|uniref:Uncharacterized protein DUF3784 n=1 Tax=Sinobaca qinghaiensis TaxID=342944 RepID=A0A419UWR6_9BACL|nr:DUF3784 domain-containing protein [Sinobaca qinghaiensis]RKD69575.1 uncharacterized protein DUF3784 [Sinobaca qinghaiensis]
MTTGLFVLPVLFSAAAFLLSRGKGSFLIAGYNILSDSEKEKYDEVALCKFMGVVMYGISLAVFLLALYEVIEYPILLVTGVGLIAIFTILVFIKVYVRDTFKK